MTTIVLIRGMTQDRDFEALGRYTDAMERISKLQHARHNLAASLARLIQPGVLSENAVIATLDIDAIEGQVSELVVVEAELSKAIDDANQYASAAGKKPVRRP